MFVTAQPLYTPRAVYREMACGPTAFSEQLLMHSAGLCHSRIPVGPSAKPQAPASPCNQPEYDFEGMLP